MVKVLDKPRAKNLIDQIEYEIRRYQKLLDELQEAVKRDK